MYILWTFINHDIDTLDTYVPLSKVKGESGHISCIAVDGDQDIYHGIAVKGGSGKFIHCSERGIGASSFIAVKGGAGHLSSMSVIGGSGHPQYCGLST